MFFTIGTEDLHESVLTALWYKLELAISYTKAQVINFIKCDVVLYYTSTSASYFTFYDVA